MTTPLAAFMERRGWDEAATAVAADRCAATITRWLAEGAVVAADGVVWSGGAATERLPRRVLGGVAATERLQRRKRRVGRLRIAG